MSDKRDEKQNDMSNRLANRFNDETDDPDNLDKPASSDNPDNGEQLTNSNNTNNCGDIDPKEDWTGRMVYVPDGDGKVDNLLAAFDGEYDRMQYETDWDIRKQRHYYPVLIQVGIDELQSMSGDDFTDAVDNLGLR